MSDNPVEAACRCFHALTELFISGAEIFVNSTGEESEEEIKAKFRKPVKRARAILSPKQEEAAD